MKNSPIAKKYSLQPVRRFPHLNLGFYSIAPTEGLVETQKQLSQDEGIQSVEIEVLENFPEPLRNNN